MNTVEHTKTGIFPRVERLRLKSEIQHVFKQNKVYGKYFTCLFTVCHATEVVPTNHPRHDQFFGYNRASYIKTLQNMGLAGTIQNSSAPQDDAIIAELHNVAKFRKVAFVVSKKVHKRANTRNRIKRQMRHIYRLNRATMPVGTKIIIIAHKRIIETHTSFDDMHRDFAEISERIKRNHGEEHL